MLLKSIQVDSDVVDEELQAKDSGELISIFGCSDSSQDELVQIISSLCSIVNILIK